MGRPNQPTATELRASLATATASRERALRLHGSGSEQFERAERRRLAVNTQLLICQSIISNGRSGRNLSRVSSIISRGAARVRDLVSREASRREIRRAVDQITSDVRAEFLSRLDNLADESLDQAIEDLRSQLSPQQLRAGSGLAIDRLGTTIPAPGGDPGIITDAIGLREILTLAAPLLWVTGSTILENRDSARDEVVPEPRQSDTNRTRDRLSRQPDGRQASRNVNRKIDFILSSVDLPAAISDAESPRAEIETIDRHFGVNGERGILQRLSNELRHEALRVAGNARDTAIVRANDDIVVGYVLHSVFAENTAIDHAANDGNRYYKDDRSARTDLWANRIIPPYRKDCLCFTQAVLENEFGDEHFADFRAAALSGARRITADDVGGMIYDLEVGGLRTVTEEDVGTNVCSREDSQSLQPRDPQTWNVWFNQQQRHVKVQLFGENRIAAVESKTDRDARYYDLVNISGDVLTPQEIRDEGQGRRNIRTDAVRQIFRQLQRDHVRAWESGGGRWDLNQAEEDRFGRILTGFFNGFRNQRGR